MADDGDRRRMTAIGARLESWGVTVRWMPGWETRGATWKRVPVGVIDHHDAAPIYTGEWGALNDIVVNNKAQFQVARCLDGVPKVAICAAGVSWHAGVGGWRFPDGLIVPTNDGNNCLYGAEKANNGLGEKATEAADYAADALFRAVLDECGSLPAHRVVAHKEYGNTPPGGWAGRKSDPTYDMNWRRDRVANFQPRQEDDMTPAESQMLADVHRMLGAGGAVQIKLPTEQTIGARVTDIQLALTKTLPELLTAASMTAALAKVAEGSSGDPEAFRAIVREEGDRLLAEFRERVTEGYDVRLEPKTDGAA